jgi:hypothetical protein
MAAIAKLRVPLDIVIVANSEHDPEHRDDEHEGNDDRFFPGAQSPFEFVDYF